MSVQQKYKLKIIIIGEHAAGKTSLIKAFVEQKFSADYRPTIGTNIFIKKVDIDDGKGEATLTLWDVAGQERWTSMRPLYYKGASGAIVVGDVTRKSTFDQIKKFWIPDLHQHNPDKIPIVLIANKSDLQWEATKEEIDKAAKDVNAVTSVITCAKTGDNVNQAFTALTKAILGKA
nr:Rab family GTPase [Candidatus Sigynarchaeota archaeon]